VRIPGSERGEPAVGRSDQSHAHHRMTVGMVDPGSRVPRSWMRRPIDTDVALEPATMACAVDRIGWFSRNPGDSYVHRNRNHRGHHHHRPAAACSGGCLAPESRPRP
jgi:hypothetical protein